MVGASQLVTPYEKPLSGAGRHHTPSRLSDQEALPVGEEIAAGLRPDEDNSCDGVRTNSEYLAEIEPGSTGLKRSETSDISIVASPQNTRHRPSRLLVRPSSHLASPGPFISGSSGISTTKSRAPQSPSAVSGVRKRPADKDVACVAKKPRPDYVGLPVNAYSLEFA